MKASVQQRSDIAAAALLPSSLNARLRCPFPPSTSLFLLQLQQDLSSAVFLVFANKQDYAGSVVSAEGDSVCMTPAEIAQELNLQAIKVSYSETGKGAGHSRGERGVNADTHCDNEEQSHAKRLLLIHVRTGLLPAPVSFSQTHPWHIQSCCALTGEGLYEVSVRASEGGVAERSQLSIIAAAVC